MDILLGNYFQPVNLFNPQTPHFFPESFETANNGGGVTLYHNNGDGTFTDVTDKAGVRFSGWALIWGMPMRTTTAMTTCMWRWISVRTDFCEQWGRDVHGYDGEGHWHRYQKGHERGLGDFNNDGLFDVYVTNITDEYMREGNFLWKNNGDGTFADVARETGTYDTGWGWAGKFFDYDNDGWQDLYVVNGWVSQGPENYVVDIFSCSPAPTSTCRTPATGRQWETRL